MYSTFVELYQYFAKHVSCFAGTESKQAFAHFLSVEIQEKRMMSTVGSVQTYLSQSRTSRSNLQQTLKISNQIKAQCFSILIGTCTAIRKYLKSYRPNDKGINSNGLLVIY